MNRRALVTNDDGVDSQGIRTLARVARQAGLDVVVAAPGWDSSGASAALTAVENNGRFRVEQRTWESADLEAVFAVEASPAFIVQAAITGAFGPPPDVVVSGINHGPNTGHAVLHSGTVGAALTAFIQGLPALAMSIGTGSPTHWETAAEFADIALRWILDAAQATILNVNVPNLSPELVGGFRRGRLAAVGAVQATVTKTGTGYLKLAYHDRHAEHEPGTDAALLAAGVASFTPLRAVCEADDVSTDGLGSSRGPGSDTQP